jgi:hypothetical protein
MPRAKRALTEKPKLGLPDSLEAAQESARLAQEGNLKLTRAVDALRTALETIVAAEWDHRMNAPVTPKDLRELASNGLDTYSQLTGQNWRLPKNKLQGSWAGGTGNKPVHESEMG